MAANVAVPYDFVASAPAVADNVDANFAAVVNWINANVVHLDASKAFTGVPSGPATDPTSANHLCRKAYVDAQALPIKVALRRAAAQSIPTGTYTLISWDTEDYDVNAFIVVPSTTLTVPVGGAGTYAISVRVTFAVPSANTIQITDGTNVLAQVNGISAQPDTVVSCTAYLAAGSLLSSYVVQSTGSSRNVTARLTAVRLSS